MVLLSKCVILTSHSLAESTLVAGLEVAPVHSPGPAEAHGQPEQQDGPHPAEEKPKGHLKFMHFNFIEQ